MLVKINNVVFEDVKELFITDTGVLIGDFEPNSIGGNVVMQVQIYTAYRHTACEEEGK